jgi:hypothetical protein
MSYSEELDIIKLFGKKVLFIDVETIGLPIQKINKEYKPEERFYHYSENEKYENSRMIQISYKYYENYNEKICDITEIIDYIIRPDGFEVNGTDFHTITNEIANENGIKINKALREIINFLLQDEIDFIVGYNIYFDINILMNELYRINKIKTLGKIQKLIDDKKIIDIAQICAKMNLVEIKNKKKYQISKQSMIYKKLFDKEQQNSHNSKYDVLNLIEITNNLYCKIMKNLKNNKYELLQYIDNYFKNDYLEKIDKRKIELYETRYVDKKYINYPEKIKIKNALQIYYGDEYDDNDYRIFLLLKKFNCITLFPYYDILESRVNMYCSPYLTPNQLINIDTEEINLNYFVNDILYNINNNNDKIRLKLYNLYFLDLDNFNDCHFNIIFNHYLENYIVNYEIIGIENFYGDDDDGKYIYIVEYDKEILEKKIIEIEKNKEKNKIIINCEYPELYDISDNTSHKSCNFFDINKCNKTINFKILGYNLFNGETDRQLEFITLNNYDILFLSESSINIIKSLQEKYIGYSVKSHCGYTYLGINKKITMNIIKKIEMNGIIFLHVKINNKYEIIFGSVHLAPFKENIKVRNEQLKIIMNELPKNIPVIFGGDTNMREEESVAEFELDDVYLLKKENKYYSTYPNRNFTSDKLKFIPKNNFRYDRFFTKNCKCLNFITIDNNESDHLAIESIIEI